MYKYMEKLTNKGKKEDEYVSPWIWETFEEHNVKYEY